MRKVKIETSDMGSFEKILFICNKFSKEMVQIEKDYFLEIARYYNFV